MSGLTWLHISDWLQREERKSDRQVIRAALIRDIRGWTAIGPDLFMMDFIMLNGNVAYNGKAEEYDALKRDLPDPLLRACNVPDRFFMVPGSHDMDRTAFEKIPSEIKMPPRS